MSPDGLDREHHGVPRRGNIPPLVITGLIALAVASVTLEFTITAFGEPMDAEVRRALLVGVPGAAALVAMAAFQANRFRSWTPLRSWAMTAGVLVLAVVVFLAVGPQLG